MLQGLISYGWPRQTPPSNSFSTIARVLCFDPSPQVVEHCVHSPHADHVQSLPAI